MFGIAAFFGSILTAGVKIWSWIRGDTSRKLGRAETEAEQGRQAIKSGEEAQDVRDKVDRMPDANVTDELRDWTKPGRDS